VIRCDLRGFGRSENPTGQPYSRIDDRQALLEKLNINQAHFIGLSMWGGIALDFAVAFPEKVNRLDLVHNPLGSITSRRFGMTRSKVFGILAINGIWLKPGGSGWPTPLY
jgi:pimeloyl-ACP methyl ester carboxylesterase